MLSMTHDLLKLSLAQAQAASEYKLGERNNTALAFFFVIVAITLVITYWAA